MDRMIYTAMTGAKAMEQRQHALSNNLANASTNGFKADVEAFRAVPLIAEGAATTRVFAVEATAGFDTAVGPIRQTDSPLDVAIRSEGFFAVQGPDGEELYTRNGAFVIGSDGMLQTADGRQVLGDGGPINVPDGAAVVIGSDGSVGAQVGQEPPIAVGRFKMVNPPADEMTKIGHGMFKMINGEPAPVDEQVTVVGGALEGSNVNVVEAMVGMIAVSRQFEMQMRMIQNAESNDSRATTILSRNG